MMPFPRELKLTEYQNFFGIILDRNNVSRSLIPTSAWLTVVPTTAVADSSDSPGDDSTHFKHTLPTVLTKAFSTTDASA